MTVRILANDTSQCYVSTCDTLVTQGLELKMVILEGAMKFFVSKFKWIMLVSGLLTCTMFLGLFAPQSSLQSNFGEAMHGPLSEILVRNWSALIGLMGVMLVYGAFVEPVRKFALVIAGISKAIFITLVLCYGKQYMGFAAGTAVIADSIMIVLYVAYLLLARSDAKAQK